jgi:hypothetical protein
MAKVRIYYDFINLKVMVYADFLVHLNPDLKRFFA